MDSLKLCLISSEFFPVWGGVGAYTLNLVRHLPEAINIHVVTMHRKIKKSTKEPTTTIAERNHEFPFHRKNLHLHFLCSTAETFFNYLKFQLLCAKEIKKLNKQYQFDIIHTQFPIMPDIFTNLFRRLRTPFVCTVHSTVETQFRSIRMDMNFSRMDRSEKGNLLLYIPLKFCENMYLRRKLERFIAVSNFIKDEFMKSYNFIDPGKVEVIHHGVDVNFFKPLSSSTELINNVQLSVSRPTILFTGRFVSKKGAQVLIKSIPRVLAHVPETLFVFAGGGDFSPYMKLLKTLRVPNSNLAYLGYINDSDMPRLYSKATVYAAPSLEDSLGIRILEAMSSGKPVIASRIGGIPEIIQPYENGLLIAPGDSAQLAKHIVYLLENEDLTKRLGQNSRETIEKRFSVKVMTEKTCNLYRKIIS